jgi:hypothetical protein
MSATLAKTTGLFNGFSHISPTMTEASPMQSGNLHFRKMNGLGNDFVVFDARLAPLAMTEDKARAIADRKTGIGCDQLIVLEPW